MPGFDRLVATTGCLEHFGQVGERLSLELECVGSPGVCDRLAGESFRFGVLAAVGVDERLHAAPVGLGNDVARVAEVASLAGERLRLVVSAESAEHPAELRRDRGESRGLTRSLHLDAQLR